MVKKHTVARKNIIEKCLIFHVFGLENSRKNLIVKVEKVCEPLE